jgi:hypothetical protein
MATKKQEVIKAENNSELPAHLRNMQSSGALGMEALDESDFILPRVKLLQATDGIVQNGDGIAGEFYHVTAKQSLGKQLAFVPIMVRKRYMLFVPNDMASSSGSRVLARSDDGINWNVPNAKFEVTLKSKKKVIWDLKGSVAESGLAEFGSEDPEDPQSRPAALLIYDVIALLPDHPELSPVSLSLKGAAISRAKSFFTGMKQARLPLWAYKCKTWGTVEKNGNNSYWNYNLAGDGWAAKEIFDEGQKIYDLSQEKVFRAADDDDDAGPVKDAGPRATNTNY